MNGFVRKSGSIFLTMVLLLCWTLAGGSNAWEIESLQKALQEKGAKWVAGETSLSYLTREEFKQMLGFRPSLGSGFSRQLSASSWDNILLTLPVAVDWRNNNGGNWISPVKNQEQCGSCYAFATLATLETLIKLDQHNPFLDVDLSEQYLVSCGPTGNRDGYDYGGCLGNYSDFVGDFLLQVGVPDEECFPYDANQVAGIEPLCDGACGDWSTRTITIADWSYIAPAATFYLPHLEEIKATLVNKPVPCGMFIYEDFKNYVGGVYSPLSGQENLGGHFVVIVGYDDSQSCWIVKNSWGPDWGENGFFRIAYNQTSINSPTMFGLEALDLEYGNTVTTTTTTAPVTTTTTIGPDSLPNLVPCAPYGWSSPIVPAAQQGTSVHTPGIDVLYPTPRKTYIDFALCNDSENKVSDTFTVSLYIDNVEAFTAEVDEPLDGKSYHVWLDERFSLSEGQHVLKVVADVNDDVAETNEEDNTFEISFTWEAKFWPRLYKSMLGENTDHSVRLLRDFRDNVLIKTGTGRAYVEILYNNSLDLVRLLFNNEKLRVQTADVIKGMLPLVSTVLAGDPVVLPPRLIAVFEELLGDYAEKARPELGVTLRKVREEIRSGKLFDELGIRVE